MIRHFSVNYPSNGATLIHHLLIRVCFMSIQHFPNSSHYLVVSPTRILLIAYENGVLMVSTTPICVTLT